MVSPAVLARCLLSAMRLPRVLGPDLYCSLMEPFFLEAESWPSPTRGCLASSPSCLTPAFALFVFVFCHVFTADIDLLYPPAISGKSPTARSGHSAAMIGTDLVVFGGVRGR